MPQFIYLFPFWYSVYFGVNPEPSRFFIRISKILVSLNVAFLEGLQPQNVLIMFLFSMKHSYLLTAKTTQDVIILSGFYMVWATLTILRMPEATIGVWLWPQLSWCSMYMSRVIILQVKFARNIKHRYFNFLFELHKGMSLTGSYLLLYVSFSLVTLEKQWRI